MIQIFSAETGSAVLLRNLKAYFRPNMAVLNEVKAAAARPNSELRSSADSLLRQSRQGEQGEGVAVPRPGEDATEWRGALCAPKGGWAVRQMDQH